MDLNLPWLFWVAASMAGAPEKEVQVSATGKTDRARYLTCSSMEIYVVVLLCRSCFHVVNGSA